MKNSRFRKLLSAEVLSILFGICITVGMTFTIIQNIRSTEQEVYNIQLTHIKNVISRKITVVEESLQNIRVLFDASSTVNNEEFKILATDVLQRHAFIQSINYLPLVIHHERADFQKSIRDIGYIEFSIQDIIDNHRKPAAKRSRYAPIAYQEPFEPTTAGRLGVDYLAIQEFEPFINKAIESGEMISTRPENVLDKQSGYTVFKALYSGASTPNDFVTRATLANGLVSLRVNAADLFSLDDLENGISISLGMRSVVPPHRALMLSQYESGHIDNDIVFPFWDIKTREEIKIANQVFTLDVEKIVTWKKRYIWNITASFIIGSVLTLLLWYIARSIKARAADLQRRNEEIQSLVKIRTNELAREKDRAQITLESIADGVITTDENGYVVYYNPVAERLTGFDESLIIGKPISHSLTLVDETSKGQIDNPIYKCLESGTSILYRDNTAMINRDGKIIAIDGAVSPIRNRDNYITGAVFAFRDVSQERSLTKQMAHQATHDALTDLPNRLLLMDRMEHEISRAPWRNTLIGVMFLDLDRFKVINDSLGHSAGDELIKQVANRLIRCLRPGDTISRFGGDEFVVILSEVMNRNDLIGIVEKIHDVLCEPYNILQQELFAQASIGIAVYPDGGKTSDELLKNADAAMYHAKSQGKNNYVFYSDEMNAKGKKRLSLETDLRHAIHRNELLLHYQPQVDTTTGKVVGAEALIRWNHPSRGLIPPIEFIPIAEENGMIVDIGSWVMREACRQNKEWQDKGHNKISIAVNIANRQFHNPKLAIEVMDILDETGLDSRYLEIELTEGILAQYSDAANNKLNKLKDIGIHLAIDDFGTGYSSLAYLKEFPIDTLKVDRCFVQDITTDASAGEICSAIIAMAHNLKLSVVAEGVELEAQYEYLKARRCDYIQGYYFSKPLVAGDFEKLIVTDEGTVSNVIRFMK